MTDFSKLPARPVPRDYRRVVLVFPAKFLGNLLIAGNLIQQYLQYCKERGIACRVVLDAAFQGLLADTFDESQVIWYPRQTIAKSTAVRKLGAYLGCLRQIRAYKPDLAVALEEDAVADRLTQLSGSTFKLGCSPLRNKYFYHNVLPIDYANRPVGKIHRWYGYQEVFSALGLPEPEKPTYLHWVPGKQIEALRERLSEFGLTFSGEKPTKRIVTVHAGATKEYKKWSLDSYAELCKLLISEGLLPVVIGAGRADAEAAVVIMQHLEASGLGGSAINLCNQLSLPELAALFNLATVAVGNDSGPFHLAASMDLPGVVIFGPTLADIWRPLGVRSVLLQAREACDPKCHRRNCLRDYACLKAITPQMVVDKLSYITTY